MHPKHKMLSRANLVCLVFCLGTVAFPAGAGVTVESPTAQGSRLSSQLVQQGRELYEAQKFSEALRVWQQAAQTYQAEKDVLNQAMVLSNVSLAYQQLGQLPQASKAIANSLKLLQIKRQDPKQLHILAQALNTQASLQLAQGQAEQALTIWQRATDTYTLSGDEVGSTRSLINQAQALRALGLYRRALVILEQANQKLDKQPDSQLKAVGLRNLGNALRVVGDLELSRQSLQRSLALAQELKLPEDIAAALFSLGNTAQSQQDNKAALEFYQQAATASSAQITTIQALLNQLSLLLDTEQWSAAQALVPQIQSQLTNLPLSSKAVYAQIDFAESLQKSKVNAEKRDVASVQKSKFTSPIYIAELLATAVKQAKSIGDQRAEAYALGNLGKLYLETQQWSIAKDLTEQALLLAQSINAPDIAYRWQWQLGRLLKAQGDTKGAIAIYTEAINTLKTLRSDLVAINPEIQFDFRDEVEPVYRELVDLLLQSPTNSQPSQQNLAQARNVIESLQLAELDNFFREACLEANSVLIDQVVDQDNPTAAVIYPIILRDRLEIIVKLPQQPLRHYTVNQSQAQVEQTLEQLRQYITEPDRTKVVKALSQKVYSWLISPAKDELANSKVKTLVFVLDGALRNIPMAALYDGKQYLVEQYAVALSPGLQLLNPKPLPPGQLKALTAGLIVPPPNFPYPPLPAIKSEFELVEQAGVSTSELLNQKFTSKSLEKQIDSFPFNVVHLATHGQFSSQARNTFILAADGPIYVKQLDYLLRSRNQSRPTALELLVLSACETAAGDQRAALGLAGVAVRAGARSTLASLWQIDDQATAIFIGEFYRELAKNKVNKAEALRQAQLALLQKYPNYNRPAYWAAYVMVGNWL